MKEAQKINALTQLEKVKQIIAAEIPEREDYSDLTFGDRLRAIREARGLTQGELAAISGNCLTIIGLYERDENVPTITRVEWLCKALNVSASDLLGF